MIKPITIVSLLLFFTTYIWSQGIQRFKVTAMGGFNVSQIDGDNYQGYDKAGVNVGLEAGIIFTRRFQVNMGLMFTQKGSKATAEQFQKNFIFRNFDLRLNYVEVPFLLHYKIKYIDKGRSRRSFYRFGLDAGFSFGRLLKISLTESLPPNFNPNNPPSGTREYFRNLVDGFNKNDFALVVGVRWYFQKNVGISLRQSFSVNKLYERPKMDDIPRLKMFNYYLYLQGFYEF